MREQRRIRAGLEGIVVALLLAFLGHVQTAGAYTSKGVGIVTALRGEVAVTHAPAVAAREDRPAQESLKFRDDVFFQDVIDTQRESTAKVLLRGRATVTIRELSRVELREGVVPGDPSRARSVLGLLAGAFRAIIQRDLRPQDELEVRTPNAVAAIRGTDLVVEVYQGTAPPPLPAAELEDTIHPVSFDLAQASAQPTTRIFVREGDVEVDGVRAGPLQGIQKVGNLAPQRFQFTPDFFGGLAGRFAVAAARPPQGVPQARMATALATQAVGQAARPASVPAFQQVLPARVAPLLVERVVQSTTAATGRDIVIDGILMGTGIAGFGGSFQFTDAVLTQRDGSRLLLSFVGSDQPPSGPPGTFDFTGRLTGSVRLLSGAPGGARLAFSSNGFTVTLNGFLALIGRRFNGPVFGTYTCMPSCFSPSGTVTGTVR